MAPVAALPARTSRLVATRSKAPLSLRPADALSSPSPRPQQQGPATTSTAAGRAASSRFVVGAAGGSSSSPRGGVIDKPSSTISPDVVKGTSRSTKRPPIYRVMLHNDNYNRREYVVRVLVKVVEGFTKEDAMGVMQEAHETGVAMVLACPQEEAEEYCETLRINGLSSSIEPGC